VHLYAEWTLINDPQSRLGGKAERFTRAPRCIGTASDAKDGLGNDLAPALARVEWADTLYLARNRSL